MPTTLDPLVGTDWLHAKLLADATLSHPTTGLVKGRVYHSDVPSPLVYPYVWLQALSIVPVVMLGGILVQLNGVYLVRVFTNGRSYTPIRAASERIIAVLNGTMGTMATGDVFSCVLDDGPLPEVDRIDTANVDLRILTQRWRLAIQ